MIKKLILITGAFLSTSLWASPMDKVCSVDIDFRQNTNFSAIEKTISRCERNNILTFYGHSTEEIYDAGYGVESPTMISIPFADFIYLFCRFDRQIVQTIEGNYKYVSCVLYDNKPRGYL